MSTTITISPAALRVLHALEQNGYPAYIVGGCLRDAMRGQTPHDMDVTTAATPAKMLEIFSRAGLRTIETGLKHGTVTALADGEPIECTTYRLDGSYTDGRHPDSVLFTDRIADDLARRDFTVNAMACRLPAAALPDFACDVALTVEIGRDAELVDLYGGQEDLAAGVLRCVGDPYRRFEEDALRILRCIRFSVQLGFTVEPRTRAALSALGDRLSKISRERCAAEWMRMLESPMPLGNGLTLIEEAQLWQYVLPHLPCAPSPADIARATLLPPDAPLRMAQLMRTPCDIYRKENPESAPAELAHVSCSALRLSNAVTRQTAAYLDGSYALCPQNDAALRRMMAHYRDLTARVLLLGGVCAMDDTHCRSLARKGGGGQTISADALPASYRRAMTRCEEIAARGDCISTEGLDIDGKTLVRFGFRGAEIGAALSFLLSLVLEYPEYNRLELLIDRALDAKEEGMFLPENQKKFPGMPKFSP
ncbi:MAG: CCA tRNA nucleotidyltransferase [Clostridia bacterium]|nr:CCA tRNA nucleotidyltransferase [Clostridia bacterium]